MPLTLVYHDPFSDSSLSYDRPGWSVDPLVIADGRLSFAQGDYPSDEEAMIAPVGVAVDPALGLVSVVKFRLVHPAGAGAYVFVYPGAASADTPSPTPTSDVKEMSAGVPVLEADWTDFPLSANQHFDPGVAFDGSQDLWLVTRIVNDVAQVLFSDDFETDTSGNYGEPSWAVAPTITGGHVASVDADVAFFPTLGGDLKVNQPASVVAKIEAPAPGAFPNIECDLILGVDSAWDGQAPSARLLGGSANGSAYALLAPGPSSDNSVALPGYTGGPAWLVVRWHDDTTFAEFWTTDPALGGAPSATISMDWTGFTPLDYRALVYVRDVQVDEWAVHSPTMTSELWTTDPAFSGTPVSQARAMWGPTGHSENRVVLEALGDPGSYIDDWALYSGVGAIPPTPAPPRPPPVVVSFETVRLPSGREVAKQTVALLDDLPPYERDSVEIQAATDVIARELARVDAGRAKVQEQYIPSTADELLSLWESSLELSVAPADQTLEQRRQRVLAFIHSIHSHGSGLEWEEGLTELIGTGWTYQEHDPADPSSPPPFTVKLTVPFGGALDAPASLAGTVTGTGTLAAGTYVYAVTATNSYGETTRSATISKTVGANGRVVLDWDDDVGATGYRVYRGPNSGSLRRLSTITSPTSAYTDDGSATPSLDPPPSVNTTQSLQAYEAGRFARRITPAHIVLIYGYGAGFIVGVSDVGDVL